MLKEICSPAPSAMACGGLGTRSRVIPAPSAAAGMPRATSTTAAADTIRLRQLLIAGPPGRRGTWPTWRDLRSRFTPVLQSPLRVTPPSGEAAALRKLGSDQLGRVDDVDRRADLAQAGLDLHRAAGVGHGDHRGAGGRDGAGLLEPEGRRHLRLGDAVHAGRAAAAAAVAEL